MKVKICGITNLEDAQAAVGAGCDAVSFIFYKRSPRYISPGKAKDIIDNLPKRVIKIGVFVNEKKETIKRIARMCGLNMLQFHGDESPEFCVRFKGYKIIKAFRIKDKLDLERVLEYKTFAYLFDTFVPGKIGGTGKKFNWKLMRHIGMIKRPIFLSGGISEKNVKKAVEIVNPDWVDVSSCLEVKPGKKDHKKIKRFLAAAKNI